MPLEEIFATWLPAERAFAERRAPVPAVLSVDVLDCRHARRAVRRQLQPSSRRPPAGGAVRAGDPAGRRAVDDPLLPAPVREEPGAVRRSAGDVRAGGRGAGRRGCGSATSRGELGGESRTLRTVQALQAAHPAHQFSLVIGSDLQAETASWYGAEELRRLVPFVVVGRGGHAPGGRRSGDHAGDQLQRRARGGCAQGVPVDQLVPRRVLDYIRERGLYGKVEEP